MGAAAAFAVAALLAGATDVSLDLRVRGEGRAVGLAPEGGDTVTRSSAELTPSAALVVRAAPASARGAYSARLSAPDLSASIDPNVTHEAELRLEARPRAPLVVGASAAASRGRTDPLADLWTEVARVDPTVTPATAVAFESARAGLDVSWDPTRRDLVTATAGAWATQGTDAPARLVLPLQRAVLGEVVYGRRVSPRDLARLSLAASGTRTEPEIEADWASASGEWRRQLTRAVEGWASGGLSLTREDSPAEAPRRGAAPVGAIGLSRTRLPRRTEEIALRTTPSVHRLGGEIQQVLSATASVRWFPAPRWSLAASAIGARAWRGPDLRLLALDLRSGWHARERLLVEVGVLARWQDEPVTGRPAFVEGAGFVAFTLDAPPLL